jgi:glycosyltransferase 2 family protein
MSKRARTIFQYVFFLGLGIFLAWWSIKDLTAEDKSHIRGALRNARYYLVIPVFAMLLFSHYIRGLRWRLLIEPLGYMPGRANACFAVMIGYLANQAVPRLGEVLKCTVLTRYEKIPTDKLIGTIILERVIDAITLLIIFGITLAIQPELYNQLTTTIIGGGDKAEAGGTPGWIVGLIAVGVIVILLLLWMLIKKKTFFDVLLLIKRIWRHVWQGIIAIRHLKKRGQFILLTVILWTLYLMGGYLGFLALKETQHLGIPEAFTVLSAGSVGMIATPGGIGAYAYLLQKSMQLYGLNAGISLAFGWLLWLFQTAVILLGGLFSFVALPYFNKTKEIEKIRPDSKENT